jgi:hypothetical protein
MENKNIINNLIIKQINESDALAFDKDFISKSHDVNFDILGKAFKGTGKIYAKLKMAVESNTCMSENCQYEYDQLKRLQQAPKEALEFLELLLSQLEITEDPNFDPNNNYEYTAANCIFKEKPGFSKSDGYDVIMNLLEDGSQELIFIGPLFEKPLVINSVALYALSEAGSTLVSETPDINEEMLILLTKVGLFDPSDILEDGTLSPTATIADEFILKNSDGSYDYEIVDIGNGKGRNILKFDLDKINKKATPFINAEVAGLLSEEQSAVAAWNVYISRGITQNEDDQMVQNANAGSLSWSYTKDLPLTQDKKVLFETKYKDYFYNNYLTPFLTNQLPTVEEDSAVFDLAEARKAKAQKFLQDNNLN